MKWLFSPSQEDGENELKQLVDERSSLILPSAQSTDNPSQSNLAEEEELLRLPSNPSNSRLEVDLQPEDIEKVSPRSLRNLACKPFSVVIYILILAGSIAFLRSGGQPEEPSSTSPIRPFPQVPYSPNARTTPTADLTLNIHTERGPISVLDPVAEVGFEQFSRPTGLSPPQCLTDKPYLLSTNNRSAMPTNAWFQNAVMLKENDEPSEMQRVHTIPYIVDMIGPISGIRLNPNYLISSTNVLQLSMIPQHSLTIGSAPTIEDIVGKRSSASRAYTVQNTTPLGFTLEWNNGAKGKFPTTSSIVRGMPYATMHYPTSFASSSTSSSSADLYPTIASEIPLRSDPIIDNNDEIKWKCDGSARVRVDSEVKFTFDQSDFTWLVFVSQPAYVKCSQSERGSDGAAKFVLQVVDLVNENPGDVFTMRQTVLDTCTAGRNTIYCKDRASDHAIEVLGDMLRENAHIYPGPDTDVEYSVRNEDMEADITYHWDARDTSSTSRRDIRSLKTSSSEEGELLIFSLQHHDAVLEKSTDDKPSATKLGDEYCRTTLRGKTCLVKGSTWVLRQDLPPISFRAPRPPRRDTLPTITSALAKDIMYELPDNYMRGAGDTYFSGKMLAKLGRILVIAEEIGEICSSPDEDCSDLQEFISQEEFDNALDRLRAGVEIWLNGTSEAPFVYDNSWGGLVSCGCEFNEETRTCNNRFPNCPGFFNPGMNFGHGDYNDHHFHQGYHIFGAAVVAHFDPDWGREFFESVLLLIRDVANPSSDDKYFPIFRHKDWFNFNSWASGISSARYINGKNQESSSEAIASYESVALYGSVMTSVWLQVNNKEKATHAARVRDAGTILTATELTAADWYYHVRHDVESREVYPPGYSHAAIGILWMMMAQFQTWFGLQPFLVVGIQLLPITPVAEVRDDQVWIRQLYNEFAESCKGDRNCEAQGWSVLQYALLATVGHVDLAMNYTQELPDDVFESAGGDGHSLTNSLWYMATRPEVEPLQLPESEEVGGWDFNCGCPDTCTRDVLSTYADGVTCQDRIEWVMKAWGYSEKESCVLVGHMDYPEECGACNTNECNQDTKHKTSVLVCPPCSEEVCFSSLNRCPKYERTYTCTDGANVGGCAAEPWSDVGQCSECCELNACDSTVSQKNTASAPKAKVTKEAVDHCPPCSKEICDGKMASMCPVFQAPFLCSSGAASGGCSPLPWNLGADCSECCTLTSCKTTEEGTVEVDEDDCPPCSRDVCRSTLNQCPLYIAPYLCMDGASEGGCSDAPWHKDTGLCEECCKITASCED